MTFSAADTEQHLPDIEGFDSWDNDRILRSLLAGQRRALDAVEGALPAISAAADAIALRLSTGGKLFYAGAGTSIRIGVQDGSELPATFGMKESQLQYLIAGGRDAMFETLASAEDNAAQGAEDAGVCTGGDAMIAIAASGRTPYTIGAAKTARALGCLVIAVTNNANSALAGNADIEVLLSSGPEVISGSTRLGAGTAQKAALNLLSTLVHTRLGQVYDGYMVNVEAGNEKLIERAAKIVSAISGASPEAARQALAQANGQVKAAILIVSGMLTLAAAQHILAGTNGNLRAALASLKSKV